MRGVAENHARETKALADAVRRGEVPRPDVVLWPENTLDSDPVRNPELGSLVADSVRELDRPLFIGAILEGPGGQAYNAGQLWRPARRRSPGTPSVSSYPFGEYIPARSLLGGLGALQLIPRDFRPGTSTAPLVAGQVGLGDVICYEIAYDDRVRDTVRAGANLLVVQRAGWPHRQWPRTAEGGQRGMGSFSVVSRASVSGAATARSSRSRRLRASEDRNEARMRATPMPPVTTSGTS